MSPKIDNRTTPREDVVDLQRLIRRVQVASDDHAHPRARARAATGRELLPVLHGALRQAEAAARSSFRRAPARSRATAAQPLRPLRPQRLPAGPGITCAPALPPDSNRLLLAA